LFTTENAYDEARGVIGVREVSRGYQQVAEWDAHGIGPHQLNLSANGEHVIVTIGGIQTHPKSGREKLNLDSMQFSSKCVVTALVLQRMSVVGGLG
jgi:hypothetical protein